MSRRLRVRPPQHFIEEVDHEIFSMDILSLSLIREGQMPFSGVRMCTILVNPSKSVGK